MSMPIRMAQNIVQGCLEHMSKVAPNGIEAQIGASTNNLHALIEVRGRLERLIGGGYKLDRLRSTLLLCSEAIRMQEAIRQQQGDQKARLLALAVGLNEVQ